ncbi:GGDEF domain-containing protein [Yoonia sp. 2307UL14-13]|uniref:GGDEF domain-containing protein n=1 Tax=Yoonia sp. 2307UL14-13 TaxID=3126506 RepID=UPI003099681E
MERFVRFTAPRDKIDFAAKLVVFLFICGVLNDLRDLVMDGPLHKNDFLKNFTDATFTALPMCSFSLLLIGHLNGLQERLYKQANRDALTRLPNRRWFMGNTPERLRAGQALMVIDIDHFKRINDQFGHDAGDRCLAQMAAHVADILDGMGTCARMGGEEFASFLAHADQGTMRDAGDRISAGFDFVAEDTQIVRVTMSVGVAVASKGLTRLDALRIADAAVYRAKAGGRARCIIHVSTDDTAIAGLMQPAE